MHTLNLFNEEVLDKHIYDGYRYIHQRLIQVGIKPFIRIGVSTPVVAMLRDTRLRQFEDQVIAILESNTHDGSTFFNYTNYSMDREILP